MISNNKLAIFLIVASVLFGTLMLTFLKLAQDDVNVYVAGFFRFLFGFGHLGVHGIDPTCIFDPGCTRPMS